jgi:ribonuclease-3
MPEYDFPDEEEYDNENNPIWKCTCCIKSHSIVETAYATSKRVAKKYAAYIVLCNICGLKNQYDEDENK